MHFAHRVSSVANAAPSAQAILDDLNVILDVDLLW
jgi:hypothetical protein